MRICVFMVHYVGTSSSVNIWFDSKQRSVLMAYRKMYSNGSPAHVQGGTSESAPDAALLLLIQQPARGNHL